MTLVLIGGGGHCRACLDVIAGSDQSVAGILDPARLPANMPPRLGDDSWLDGETASSHSYLVTVGQIEISALRRSIFEKLQARGLKSATIISAHAIVSQKAEIGSGSIVMHRATLNHSAVVGQNCIINTGAIIEHDARIADHCHVSTGTVINGGVEIGSGCLIGSGAIILPNIKIAANVVIAAGAVVTRDIESAGTYFGIPAKRLA